MSKKAKALTQVGLSIVTVIFELLPYGAVCHFANPEGKPLRQTFSYFDPLPFGYANFGPLLTAWLTCALLLLCVLALFRAWSALRPAITAVSAIGTAVSLTPLLYGIRYFSVVGGVISALLLAITLLSVLWRPRSDDPQPKNPTSQEEIK